jgi:hypothetical protein
MSFETTIMKFVERMLVIGRRREVKRDPEKVAEIDKALAKVRKERAAALDKDIVRKQAERSTLD